MSALGLFYTRRFPSYRPARAYPPVLPPQPSVSKLKARKAERLLLFADALADGLTVKEAGRHVGISETSAHNYMKALYGRLGPQAEGKWLVPGKWDERGNRLS
jgi:DNA-binding NarL/FixJ family response regulator